MAKYLVIECIPLDDPYECDARRQPVCVTDDCSRYGEGFEVWEIKADGSLALVKEYWLSQMQI